MSKKDIPLPQPTFVCSSERRKAYLIISMGHMRECGSERKVGALRLPTGHQANEMCCLL